MSGNITYSLQVNTVLLAAHFSVIMKFVVCFAMLMVSANVARGGDTLTSK